MRKIKDYLQNLVLFAQGTQTLIWLCTVTGISVSVASMSLYINQVIEWLAVAFVPTIMVTIIYFWAKWVEYNENKRQLVIADLESQFHELHANKPFHGFDGLGEVNNNQMEYRLLSLKLKDTFGFSGPPLGADGFTWYPFLREILPYLKMKDYKSAKIFADRFVQQWEKSHESDA